MLLKRVSVENVRSFKYKQELILDGKISILIGPNGGGKTNLLDAIITAIRRHIFKSYQMHFVEQDGRQLTVFRENDQAHSMALEPYTGNGRYPTIVEIDLEVTESDIETMKAIQRDYPELRRLGNQKYGDPVTSVSQGWNISAITAGQKFTYKIQNNQLVPTQDPDANSFLQYLSVFEIYRMMREDILQEPLTTPVLYLPVTRAQAAFQTLISLSNFNEHETRRNNELGTSRNQQTYLLRALSRIALRWRILETNGGNARLEFYKDPQIKDLTAALRNLGYNWRLVLKDIMRNDYTIELEKQGTNFLVGNSSPGEKELLNYLFVIYGLNVRGALVIVDEPELHLHPKWQNSLLSLFSRLSEETGNQFLLATHSPSFITPDTIHCVSRVYSVLQASHIARLDPNQFPDVRHRVNIVNSQNNERLFFADKVILVEGIGDRLFFEKLLALFPEDGSKTKVIEIIDVGGKSYFEIYRKLLRSASIEYEIIADLDYIEQIGTEDIKTLFKTNNSNIKKDVIDNIKSNDGDALVKAIDGAMATGNWDDAQGVWNYIKSRRRQRRTDLDAEEETKLQTFLEAQKSKGIYILSRGALEAYLPAGNARKNIDDLVTLLESSDFWQQIPSDVRDELLSIVRAIQLPRLVRGPDSLEAHAWQRIPPRRLLRLPPQRA